MAIFGKADANLPLVTQLMQVDVTDEHELYRFLRRTMAFARLVHQTRLPPFAVSAADVVRLETAPPEPFPHVDVDTMELLKLACVLAEQIFLSLFKDFTVPLEVLELLREKFPTSNRVQLNPTMRFVREPGQITQVRLTDFWTDDADGFAAPGLFIASQVEQALTDLRNGQVTIAACLECKNVFLASRQGQSYCSHRCSARVRQRRRRSSEKVTL